jgi:hypothetical protein
VRYTAYYLIEPKPVLVDRLRAEVDDVFADAMLEPELLANEQGGRSLWGPIEYHLKMKLLWLARFREYEPFASDDVVRRILGTAELSEAAFDAGWTIREITFSGESREFIDDLKPLLHLTEPTGNDIVDAWLDTLR